MVTAPFVPEVAAFKLLWPVLHGRLTCRCMNESLLVLHESLWQNVEYAFSHAKRTVHCWRKPYLSRIRELDEKHLRIANAWVFFMTNAPSRIQHGIAKFMVVKMDVLLKLRSSLLTMGRRCSRTGRPNSK